MVETTLALGFVISSALSMALVLTKPWHIRFTGDCAKSGPQKLHGNIVPRVGGVAVFFSVLIACCYAYQQNSAQGTTMLTVCLLLSPCMLVGFAEDIFKQVSALQRYVVTMISAAITCWLMDIAIHSVAIAPLDALLTSKLIATGFAVFAIANVAHAFNLIDGQNGLCSGSAVISSLCIAAVAAHYDLTTITLLGMLCAVANLGFLLFNYPSGRIFLGDAGAYFNGALIALMAVWLVQKAPEVSPWFALNALLYPVWETFYSIWRRVRNGQSISAPDAEHMHSLLYRNAQRRTKNLLFTKSSAPVIWLGYATVCLLAVLNHDNTVAQLIISVAAVIFYVLCYRLVLRSHQSAEAATNTHHSVSALPDS